MRACAYHKTRHTLYHLLHAPPPPLQFILCAACKGVVEQQYRRKQQHGPQQGQWSVVLWQEQPRERHQGIVGVVVVCIALET